MCTSDLFRVIDSFLIQNITEIQNGQLYDGGTMRVFSENEQIFSYLFRICRILPKENVIPIFDRKAGGARKDLQTSRIHRLLLVSKLR
jgi:hypothetical protein